MTEPAFVTETRAAYDTVAADYAEVLRDLLADSTFDRAMLGAFAELVPEGRVAEIGCGPGRIAAHLASLGLDVFGVDLSPQMVEVARERYPGLRFEVGTMLALDLPDASLDGLVAWYSIIHTPPGRLPEVFAEFARVLKPGGYLLLAFQAGDDHRHHIERAYNHDVSLDAYRLSPDRIGELLSAAGFEETARLLRRPEGFEKTPQAYLLSQREH
ncbi:class I SAM-dependent DNA methyltransferase [Amycolatopsis sacchari]|uniref:class I SAM-dependent DNA methyltransferase n=1 Tax=Amycolatopsis sacchari TaxID=115433 RepID=UPI003D72FCE5